MKIFFFQTQALATSLNLMPPPQHDPSIHIFHSLVLRCAKEYFQIARIFAPFSPTPRLQTPPQPSPLFILNQMVFFHITSKITN
jgi:hypothetical protein